MDNSRVYRCDKPCPIGKNCFVIKLAEALEKPLVVLQKCPAKKGEDIKITIK